VDSEIFFPSVPFGVFPSLSFPSPLSPPLRPGAESPLWTPFGFFFRGARSPFPSRRTIFLTKPGPFPFFGLGQLLCVGSNDFPRFGVFFSPSPPPPELDLAGRRAGVGFSRGRILFLSLEEPSEPVKRREPFRVQVPLRVFFPLLSRTSVPFLRFWAEGRFLVHDTPPFFFSSFFFFSIFNNPSVFVVVSTFSPVNKGALPGLCGASFQDPRSGLPSKVESFLFRGGHTIKEGARESPGF